MSELYLMVTISDRNFHRRLLAFYKEYGVTVTMVTLGRGTATSEVLDSFGLEAAEKAIQFAFVTGREWKEIRSGLEKRLKIDIPGTGIAFVIPVSSIGGKKQLQFLTEGRGFEKGEESTLKDTKYELLVVVANQGYTEYIMEAARSANAAGGENGFQDMIDVMLTIVKATLVEPTYDELSQAGITLTDEQMVAIFQYSQNGPRALERFRTKPAHGDADRDERNAQPRAERDT